MGHPVTLFEAEKQVGGILRLAIPQHRLPEAVLERDLSRIMGLGIEVRCNARIGARKLKSLLAEFQAVFYAAGAHQSRRLELRGADGRQVISGLQFLKAVRDSRLKKLPGRVVVIGGGNVAIDVAMTARRLGADQIDIVSLEQRNELPAHEGDFLDAQEEDIRFHLGWGPAEISVVADQALNVKCVRCVSVFDPHGRFAPEFNQKETLTLNADWVIPAIGQLSDFDGWDDDPFNMPARRLLQTNPHTLAAAVKGLYAGGDVSGACGSVSAALGAGKRAAVSIHLQLNSSIYAKAIADTEFVEGQGFSIEEFFNPRQSWDPKSVVAFSDIDPLYLQHRGALPLPRLDAHQRIKGFDEINRGFDADMALIEAGRCFYCGTCVGCERCLLMCPDLSIHPIEGKPFMYQPHDPYCKGCGTCAAVCNRGVMKFGDRS